MKRKIWLLAVLAGLCVLIAGIVFSAWYGGMSTGLMGNAEQGFISNVQFIEDAPTGDIIRLTMKNAGSTTVNIYKGQANGIEAVNFNSGNTYSIPKGYSLEIPLVFPNDTLVYGSQYTVKVITVKGTTCQYSEVYDSMHTSQYDQLKDDLNPKPFENTPEPLEPFWDSEFNRAVIVFSLATLILVPAACKLACYIVGPKNKGDLIMLLFLVTVMVVAAIIYVVTMVLFPPQISL